MANLVGLNSRNERILHEEVFSKLLENKPSVNLSKNKKHVL